ncbi:MAG TPA: PAS domain-containing protein [Terriglobales bacterium]|nr:PAS domain-containing protein [Terriglobales bacterium]
MDKTHVISKEDSLQAPTISSEPPAQELRLLRSQFSSLLEMLQSAIITLDTTDVITGCNDAAVALWGISGANLVGSKLQTTELVRRCPELLAGLEANRDSSTQPARFRCSIECDGENQLIEVGVQHLLSSTGEQIGTALRLQTIGTESELQRPVEQSSCGSDCEAMRTADEESLCISEELQATNEELEATSRELESLSEKLLALNNRLEAHSRELKLASPYADMFMDMPWPVVLIDSDERIKFCNPAALRSLDLGESSALGIGIDRLSVSNRFREGLLKGCRAALAEGKSMTLRSSEFKLPRSTPVFDVFFSPVSHENSHNSGVLVVFGSTTADLFRGPIRTNDMIENGQRRPPLRRVA